MMTEIKASEVKPGMKSRNLVLNKMDMRCGQYVPITIDHVRPATPDEIPFAHDLYVVIEFTSDIRDEFGASYGRGWCRKADSLVEVEIR